MSNKTYKRRTLFIKRRYQATFIAWVIGLLIVCCLCSAAVLYPLLSSEVSSQLSAGHRNTGQTGDRLVLVILTGNLLAIIVAALASTVVILYISHKIAGPLYRFERVCEEVGRGNFDVSAKLRDADQLKDLSQAFAAMLVQLRDRQHGQRVRLEKARENVDALRDSLADGHANPEALASLRNLLGTLVEEMKERKS